jgi:hypothetical protein
MFAFVLSKYTQTEEKLCRVCIKWSSASSTLGYCDASPAPRQIDARRKAQQLTAKASSFDQNFPQSIPVEGDLRAGQVHLQFE